MEIEPTEQSTYLEKLKEIEAYKKTMFHFIESIDDIVYVQPSSIIASALVYYRRSEHSDAELTDYICNALHLYMKSNGLKLVPSKSSNRTLYCGMLFERDGK